MAGHIEDRGNGRYRLTVEGLRGPNGKRKRHRKTVSASSPRQAAKLLAQFVTEVEKGEYLEPTKLTFSEFISFWKENYAHNNLAPRTITEYDKIFKNYLLEIFGHIKMDQIKTFHIVQYITNLQSDGIRADGKEGALSTSSIQSHYGILRSIFKRAVEWEVIKSDPTDNVKLPKLEQQEINIYDGALTAKMLECATKEKLQFYVAVSLTVTAGLRLGELLGLEWTHLDAENNMLDIKQIKQRIPGKGIVFKSPKTKSSIRTISIPDDVVVLLKAHRNEQLKIRLKVGDRWKGGERDLIFCTWHGTPLDSGTFRKKFQSFLIKNNLPKIRFHDLRHISATFLISEGVNIKSVSKRLGHAHTSTTTNIYAHALKSVDKEAADKFNNILPKARGQA